MEEDYVRRRSVRRTDAAGVPVQSESVEVVQTGPRGPELVRRLVIFLFAIVQVLIILRIVLLLLDAREANALVSAILDASQVFVAPFEGIFNTDALREGGSVLDVAAVAALVGWTVLELLVIAAIDIFRRREV